MTTLATTPPTTPDDATLADDSPSLWLSANEKFRIGEVEVVVVAVRTTGVVRLGVNAPHEMRVMRGEDAGGGTIHQGRSER